MVTNRIIRTVLIMSCYSCLVAGGALTSVHAQSLSGLKDGESVATFKVSKLLSDPDGTIIAAKFVHTLSGAPVFLLQSETVPQVFLWFDTPSTSDRGLAHGLEHLLIRGTKGSSFLALENMRLAQISVASYQDFNYYGIAASAGMNTFFELFHACLDSLYHPDFTDHEVEREIYHFGVKSDPTTMHKSLVESGTIYDEVESSVGRYDYYFQLNKRVLGGDNPFGFNNAGVPDELRRLLRGKFANFTINITSSGRQQDSFSF